MDYSFFNTLKTLFFWFLVILVISFFLWYLGGGPARWDAKFERIIEIKKETQY